MEELPIIESVYDGFVTKIQACGAKGSLILTNVQEYAPTSPFESGEALIEQFYLGCLSSEMMEFLWTGHFGKERHKERLLAFYKFFNYDLTVVAPSIYFTIFPEMCEPGILEEDLGTLDEVEENFSSKGIYVKIPQMCYQQNKTIDIDFINARNSRLMASEPGTLVEVEHFFTMKTMQALFTKLIGEKIIRHLSQNLNIQAFRKGVRPRLSKQAEQAIANSPAKLVGKLPLPKRDNDSPLLNPWKKIPKKTVPAVAPSIELQALISIDIPQINIQNELKKSQAIVTTGERICVLIYNTYVQDQSQKYWIQKTGWAFIPSLKCYIAPTNLYKQEKTMWLSFQPEQQTLGKRNLMEIIMFARNNEILINVMNPEFYDLVKPMLSLDIKLQDVDIYTDSTNWWKFMDILDIFIFDRGQREEDERSGEALKRTEITNYSKDLLANIIYQNLAKAKEEKKQGKVKYIRKRISYSLPRFNLFLLENGMKFAIFRIEQLEGSHIINSEMESEINIDVHMIKVENYVDPDHFRVVLCPLLEGEIRSFEDKNSMLRLRIKDGYAKGIVGAPWKMYEQFELYLFPINIKLTKNFYRKIKNFFVPTSSLEEVKNDPVYRKKDESEGAVIKPYTKLIEKEDRMFKSVLEGSPTQQKTVSPSKPSPSPKKEIKKEEEKEKSEQDAQQAAAKKVAFPSYFKYLRLNEIRTNLSFSSGMDILNIQNIRMNLKEFVERYKFWSFSDLIEGIESHAISCALKQIPSIIGQNIFPRRPNECSIDETKAEEDAKKKLFGSFASKRK